MPFHFLTVRTSFLSFLESNNPVMFMNAGTVFLPESPLHHISIKEASSF